VDNQADFPDAARDFAAKVDAFEPNLEAIAALEPDLVIVANDTAELVASLDRLGIPVHYADLDSDVTTIDGVLDQIEELGRITDTSERAEVIVAGLRERIDDVRGVVETIPDDARPSVYHELDSAFYSAADDTFIGDIYVLLGAENIAGDGGGTSYPQLTQEAIIAANPEIIVLADEEFGVTVDSVKARPGWDAIDAVRNGRIYGVDPDIISRPGPRIVDALEQLAARFYPEAVEETP
jgi:iron complex transport system substrate-binding protein